MRRPTSATGAAFSVEAPQRIKPRRKRRRSSGERAKKDAALAQRIEQVSEHRRLARNERRPNDAARLDKELNGLESRDVFSDGVLVKPARPSGLFAAKRQHDPLATSDLDGPVNRHARHFDSGGMAR